MIGLKRGILITKGEGDLGRIYEKLRKRSYRRAVRSYQETFYLSADQFGDWLEENTYWSDADHEVYVQGVRDALKEVSKL